MTSTKTKPIEYHTIMSATMAPDVYDGPNCDQHRPRWMCSAEDDMDGPSECGLEDGSIAFDPKTFPAGTRIIVKVPMCPKCEKPAYHDEKACDCGFDWHEWAGQEFS